MVSTPILNSFLGSLQIKIRSLESSKIMKENDILIYLGFIQVNHQPRAVGHPRFFIKKLIKAIVFCKTAVLKLGSIELQGFGDAAAGVWQRSE